MSDVGAMVDALVEAGCSPGVAARIVAEAFTAGVASAVVRSGGIPVDLTAEKRREWDRNRKRNKTNSGGIPVESGGIPQEAPTQDINIKKKVGTRKHPLPPEWQPNESHFEKAAEKQIPRSAVLSKAEDMRLWAQSSGSTKADWDATFHGFLRRDADKLRERTVAPSATAVPNELAVQLFQKSGRWHRDYGPEPGKPGCRVPADVLQRFGLGGS